MLFCRTKLLIVFFILTFALVGCSALPQVATQETTQDTPQATPQATTQTITDETAAPIPLKVAVAPYLSYAPFYIAEAEGFFEEEGLDVELVRVTRSSEAVASLAQGQLDVGGFQIASGLLNAIVRDSGLKIVAAKERLTEQECVYGGFVVRKGIPLSKTATVTPELLKSLRYDSNTTGQSAYILELLLQQYGLSLGDLTINDVGDAAVTLEVMKQGGLDFSAMIEPWITQARSTGAGDLWLSYNDVAPEAQLAVIAYGPTILKDNPEAGERFMVAYLKAVRRFDEGMTESTLTLLEKVLELDHSLLSEMCPPFVPPDGMINAQSIVDFGEWAAAKDLIDAPVTTEMFWEPRFIEYANRQLKDSD